MRKVIGKRGQTMLDVAVEWCGDIDSAYEIARANGLEVDSVLDADCELDVPYGKEAEGIEPCTRTIDSTPWNKIGSAMVGELTV